MPWCGRSWLYQGGGVLLQGGGGLPTFPAKKSQPGIFWDFAKNGERPPTQARMERSPNFSFERDTTTYVFLHLPPLPRPGLPARFAKKRQESPEIPKSPPSRIDENRGVGSPPGSGEGPTDLLTEERGADCTVLYCTVLCCAVLYCRARGPGWCPAPYAIAPPALYSILGFTGLAFPRK